MHPTSSICVPFRTDRGHREAIYRWLHGYYRHTLPDAAWIPGTDDGEGTPVNRSLMRNRAADAATTDILCFLDADALIRPVDIRAAVDRVQQGAKIVRFHGLHWLTRAKTDALLATKPAKPFTVDLRTETEQYSPTFDGFFYAMTRDTFTEIGGFDTRCYEWGEEDVCFNIVSEALYGESTFIDTALYHLWHDANSRITMSEAFSRNQCIMHEYEEIANTGDAQKMRDYCRTRQPFVWTPPPWHRVISKAALTFRHPAGKEPPFALPRNVATDLPPWVKFDSLYHTCLNAGVIRLVE